MKKEASKSISARVISDVDTNLSKLSKICKGKG
jgi:hypothetical protein